MIIVGFGKASHDSSICVYDNGRMRYRKCERHIGKKHAWANDLWYWQTLNDWEIQPKDIDLIVETDNGDFRSSGVPRLPFGGDTFWVQDNKIVLDHHTAHVFANSDYSDDQLIVIDGRGSDDHNLLIVKDGQTIRSKDNFIGNIYRNIGVHMGFDPIDAPGKVMGLASYGEIDSSIESFFKGKIPQCSPDQMTEYMSLLFPNGGNANDFKWINFVHTMHELLYQSVLQLFSVFDKSKTILYTGGCALNVDWNRRLLDEGYNLKLEPAVYDGGLSIGCVRYGMKTLDVDNAWFDNYPYIQDDECPEQVTNEVINKVAELLAQGKIVGWYQGHGELGPRALGNRSILMRPDIKDGKDTINVKVKGREWWRPFGASVKKDKAHEYFDLHESPYMLYSSKVLRNDLQSITHIDGTCRHQTVTSEQNKTYYRLLDAFEKKTGLAVLLNTSLNLGGKPIASTKAEAIELFETSEMDVLCLGNTLLLK